MEMDVNLTARAEDQQLPWFDSLLRFPWLFPGTDGIISHADFFRLEEIPEIARHGPPNLIRHRFLQAGRMPQGTADLLEAGPLRPFRAEREGGRGQTEGEDQEKRGKSERQRGSHD